MIFSFIILLSLSAVGTTEHSSNIVYLLLTPDEVNASSTMLRITNGHAEWQKPLGMHAVFGESPERIVTVGLIEGKRRVTVWDKCSGEVKMIHTFELSELPTPSLLRGSAGGVLRLDPKGETAYFQKMDKELNKIYEVNLRSGKVRQLQVPMKDKMLPNWFWTTTGLLLVHHDGSLARLDYQQDEFRAVLERHIPRKMASRAEFVEGIGLIKKDEADSLIRVTDADLNPLEPPFVLVKGPVKFFSAVFIHKRPALMYTEPVDIKQNTKVVLLDPETRNEIWSKSFPGTFKNITVSKEGEVFLFVTSKNDRAILYNRALDKDLQIIDLSKFGNAAIIPGFTCQKRAK